MKKLYRNVLFFASAVVFLAVAPLVVLYAMGYRFSSATSVDPTPIGVILVETKPSRAQVFVNDKLVGTSPEAISELPPGPAKIRVTKSGYYPWEKTVTVTPGRITEVRSIRLFPENPSATTLLSDQTSAITAFSLSPNRRLAAVVDVNNKLSLVDESDLLVTPPVALDPSPAKPASLLWSPDNSALIVQYSNRPPEVVNFSTRQRADLPASLLGEVEKIVWDPRVPNRLLTLNKENSLYAYNLTNNDTSLIASNTATFATSSRNIYTVPAVSADPPHLIRHNLQGLELEIIPLLSESQPLTDKIKQLLITPNADIALQTDSGALYAMQDKNLTKLIDSALSVGWSPDNNILYIQSDPSTLYVYNINSDEPSWLPSGQLHLVNRLSQTISHPQWFAGSRHLIYQINDQIVITEIDTRDHPVTQTIASTNLGDSQIAVGQDGAKLFYLNKPPDSPNTQLVSLELIL